LNNAVKFTDRGEVVLTVGGSQDESSDHWRLDFSLEDTGVGIAKGKLAEVLRPFKQASNKMDVSGTGLGLSICHKLIGLMDGSILLSPVSEGLGTCVTFDLHLKVSETTEPIQSMQDLQVLIIDDYDRNRKQFRERLVTWGAVPLIAETAEEALKLLTRKLKLGLIIVDERMLSNNRELFKKLTRPPLSNSAFLVLGNGFNKRPLLMNPRVQFVRKPVHWTAMNGLVYELIHRQIGASNVKRTRQSIPNIAAKVPLKILVAEDHPTNQTVLGMLLRRLGYEAEYTSDGLEAVRSYEASKHDLVLMDIQMPKLGGVEATKQIRAISGDTEKPWIIALTANAFGNMKAHYLNSGLNDFACKPLGLQDIYKVFLRIPAVQSIFKETLNGSSKIIPRVDSQRAVIDWSVLQSLVDVSQITSAEFDQLLLSFNTSFSETLKALHSGYEDKDWLGFHRAAHTLLGSCTTFGALHLGGLLRLVNDMKEFESHGSGEFLTEIGGAYSEFAKALANWSAHITLKDSLGESRSGQ
ncbi:MAG: response regulator, partial [Planctomycetota bacterium]|nr:response regulator [Planctomycetota bacterium]